MDEEQLRKRAHEADVTLWVGKGGVSAVSAELDDQLSERELVKVKFLRAARGGASSDALAGELAASVGAELVETRGNTAVYVR